MEGTRGSRWPVAAVLVAVAVTIVVPCAAQNLVVIRAQSVGAVMDDVEAVAAAAGEAVDRQMLLAGALGQLGIERTDVVAMDRPLVVVLPVQGMMLQQKGFVAAIPVTDGEAVVDALVARFPDHAVEEGLHSFGPAEGPALYLLESDGYLRVGGSADLVRGVDPLATATLPSALGLEVFLEPVAPMAEAGLEAVDQRIKTEMESAPVKEEMPVDPEAMQSMIDLYLDGARWLLANTSSVRIGLDVKDGYVRLSKSLVAKDGSALAHFIAAQTGGLPAIARLADPGAAFTMAGSITLTPEHRQALKVFGESYMDLMTTMFADRTGGTAGDAEGGEASPEESKPAPIPTFWQQYITAMGPYTDRWVDCWRGDMVASFGFSDEGPLGFTEVLGLLPDEGCRTLLAEMEDQLVQSIHDDEELAAVFAVSDGPQIGGARSRLMTMDMKKLLDTVGLPADPGAEQAMASVYGESFKAATATVGDTVVVASGDDAVDRLRAVSAKLESKGPAQAPSFAPLSEGPGLLAVLDLGRLLGGIKGMVPEAAEALERPAAALGGGAGRIPMAMRFGGGAVSFEVATPLRTIEVVATLVKEQREKMAAAAAEPEPEPTEPSPE